MVAGHLREQNGIYQIILSWKDINGKRKSKQISTGLPVKGNKKRAEQMLMKARTEFDPEEALNKADIFFDRFLQKWLKDRATLMNPDLYASHAYNIKTSLGILMHTRSVYKNYPQQILKGFMSMNVRKTKHLQTAYLNYMKQSSLL